MNIVFHCVAATGIIALAAAPLKNGKPILSSLVMLALGIISHGALDYIPHQYPIKSSIDVLSGLCYIVLILFLLRSTFRIAAAACFIGAIAPDIIDHSLEISNKYLHTSILIWKNIFPWHWHEYSGSLYGVGATVSHFNHLCLIFFVAVIIFWNWKVFRILFR